MAGIAQNRQKCLIFIVVPPTRTKIREMGKQEKKHDVLGKHTNIYQNVYIYTHPCTMKHITTNTHIHIQIHIMCYSIQIVLSDIA